ncbi:unnamed protein product [Vicia faba]|uniref:Uncharacterized protein n=1 Tax=Vicia faba TaxID=3906 RepID=A0AAV1B964_VICFA|nr:unnamed protein product [Vicia faba]
MHSKITSSNHHTTSPNTLATSEQLDEFFDQHFLLEPTNPSSFNTVPTSSSIPSQHDKISDDSSLIPNYIQTQPIIDLIPTNLNNVSIPIRKSSKNEHPPSYLKDYHSNLLSGTITNPDSAASTSSFSCPCLTKRTLTWSENTHLTLFSLSVSGFCHWISLSLSTPSSSSSHFQVALVRNLLSSFVDIC